MTNKSTPLTPTRRTVLMGMAAGGALMTTGLGARFAQAQSSEPIRIGFQLTAPASAHPMAAGTNAPRPPR